MTRDTLYRLIMVLLWIYIVVTGWFLLTVAPPSGHPLFG